MAFLRKIMSKRNRPLTGALGKSIKRKGVDIMVVRKLLKDGNFLVLVDGLKVGVVDKDGKCVK